MRQGTRKRCNLKANTNRVSSLLRHQLRSLLFLVQAIGMSVTILDQGLQIFHTHLLYQHPPL